MNTQAYLFAFATALFYFSTVSAVGINATCTDPTNCTVANSTCGVSPKKCQCVTNYVAESTTKCSLALKQACTNVTACITNAECSSGKCACKTNYEENTGVCVRKNCTTSPATKCLSANNQQCNNATALCECITGFSFVQNICKADVKSSTVSTILAKDNCTMSASTKCPIASHQICNNNTALCECRSGYTFDQTKSCKENAKINTTCTTNGNECSFGSAHLNCVSKQCACANGYHEVANKGCVEDAHSGAAQMLISTVVVLVTASVAMIGT